ncbi:MAG: hypothetical protein AAFO15_01900 [Pseudomonadota bacterium]
MLSSIYSHLRDWLKGAHVVMQEKIDAHVMKIRNKIDEMNELSDAMLQLKTMELKNIITEYKLELHTSNSNFNVFLDSVEINDVIIEAMAVFAIALDRTSGMMPYDVQFVAAYVLLGDNIAEMKTGEGKTVSISIAAYIKSLFNKVHIVTANKYLVKRDAMEMGRVYKFLGLSVAIVENNMPSSKLKEVFSKDIVYGTGSDFVFVYLYNLLAAKLDDLFVDADGCIQLKDVYIIMDEIDSILIDEGRTPLIISGPEKSEGSFFALAKDLINCLNLEDIKIMKKEGNIMLLDDGVGKVENILREQGVIQQDESIMDSKHIVLMHYINNALRAQYLYEEGRDYMISNGKLLLIDPVTGRVLEDRSYSSGLHQAIQAKHDLSIDKMNRILSSMTYDYYFSKYKSMVGTTGTAAFEQREFKDVYGLDVVVIPTKEENLRIDHDDLIFCTTKERDKALIDHVKKLYKEKRPILLYTLNENDSEKFSLLLRRNKIVHKVLNAKNHEKEAYIIAQAGRLGCVTVVTNIAGRGTDIKIGGNYYMMAQQAGFLDDVDQLERIKQECIEEKEKVKEIGGLAIVAAKRNDNRRLDDQMSGRAGRQGEPGSSVFFISLEDELFMHLGKENIARIQSLMQGFGGLKKGEAIEDSYINSAILTAQKSKEAQNRQIRSSSRRFMNISLVQLDKIFDMRLQVLFESNMYDIFKFNLKEEVVYMVNSYVNEATNELDNIDELVDQIIKRFQINITTDQIKDRNLTFVVDLLVNELIKVVDISQEKLCDRFDAILQDVYLKIIDELWINHINELDVLKQVIILRAYGQKDVDVEYNKESYNLFVNMLNKIRKVFVISILQLKVDG